MAVYFDYIMPALGGEWSHLMHHISRKVLFILKSTGCLVLPDAHYMAINHQPRKPWKTYRFMYFITVIHILLRYWKVSNFLAILLCFSNDVFSWHVVSINFPLLYINPGAWPQDLGCQFLSLFLARSLLKAERVRQDLVIFTAIDFGKIVSGLCSKPCFFVTLAMHIMFANCVPSLTKLHLVS